MSKFNSGDVAYATGKNGYRKFYVDFVEDGIVYCEDDTDFLEVQLLTEAEYNAEMDKVYKKVSPKQVSDNGRDALAAYLDSKINTTDGINRKVISVIDSINPTIVEAVSLAFVESICKEDEREYIDITKVRGFFTQHLTPFERVKAIAAVLECPVGVLQTAVDVSCGSSDSLMRMAIAKCLPNIVGAMLLYKAKMSIQGSTSENLQKV